MFPLNFISASREYSTLEKMVPAPLLRRSFCLEGLPAIRAKVTVCGLGFYELYINGTKITKGLISPYISNPDDILYYDEYDIAPYIREGENVLGLMLGNGMLNCPGGDIWDLQDVRYRSAPKAALRCEIELDKGESVIFEADEAFLCAPGPIYFDDLRAGEFYDANREIPGWNEPGFDASGWTPAIQAETPRGECRLAAAEPIGAVREIKPVSIRRGFIGEDPHFRKTLPVVEPQGEEAVREGWLYDFGVNAAGLCRLKIKGKPGQKVILQFGETLDAEGRLDLRGMTFLPKALNHRDIYICRGTGEEIWMPSFTYHGFRYCLVLGLEEGQAKEELLTYVVMNSLLRSRGSFTCSDPVINALQEATLVSDMANFYYFPTDCPHREKNGWTADAALSTEQMLLNYEPEASYREWLRNIRKAQREDGALPGIIPTGGWGFEWGNGPAWDSIIVYLPYYIWKYRGDTAIVRENAEAVVRYINYITTRRDELGLIHIGLGDWCHSARSGEPKAPLEFTDTAMCMDICRKAWVIFNACGMKAQAAFADAVYGEFRSAARKYLIDTHTMTALGDCQASQAMAIFYDLFDEAEKPEAVRVLVDMIHQNSDLMDFGVLGNRAIFHVLSAYGYTDLAMNMIKGPAYPSFGYWLEQGATSLWESFWPEGAAPASCNHHFWGDISGWMYEALGGIHVNPKDTSPDEILIKPCFAKGLDHVSARHELPLGELSVEWTRDDDGITLKLKVPESCRGAVMADAGLQFDDGTHYKPLAGGTYRMLPIEMKDTKYYG
ncbi:MAG: family 78 glycoside hydrolase catalytic domain [Clostridia bacterium]|nr:family 78 glycoside hydrolase catalytic domain [Clostridia bacterium]